MQSNIFLKLKSFFEKSVYKIFILPQTSGNAGVEVRLSISELEQIGSVVLQFQVVLNFLPKRHNEEHIESVAPVLGSTDERSAQRLNQLEKLQTPQNKMAPQ